MLRTAYMFLTYSEPEQMCMLDNQLRMNRPSHRSFLDVTLAMKLAEEMRDFG